MNTLPFDCVYNIAILDPESWFLLVRVVRKLALYFRENKAFRDWLLAKFTRISITEGRICHVLPGGLYHSVGGYPSAFVLFRCGGWLTSEKAAGVLYGGPLKDAAAENTRLEYARVVYACGKKEWHYMGKLQSINGNPGIISIDAKLSVWFDEGEIHRDNDLPAVESDSGSKLWYQRGHLKRDDPTLPTGFFPNGNRDFFEEWHDFYAGSKNNNK